MLVFHHWLVWKSFFLLKIEFFFSIHLAGRWPHMIPLVYTIQALFLITLRFFIYKRKSWHYFGKFRKITFLTLMQGRQSGSHWVSVASGIRWDLLFLSCGIQWDPWDLEIRFFPLALMFSFCILVYDLCYYVNLLTLLYLWIFPSSKILFTVCYTLSHGPLAFAIVLWRNSLVFHSKILIHINNIYWYSFFIK